MYCLCGSRYCKRDCLGRFSGFLVFGIMAAQVADGTGCLAFGGFHLFGAALLAVGFDRAGRALTDSGC
jgi:hypothetical protein